MTCIAGIVCGDKVYLGGDSCYTKGLAHRDFTNRKVFLRSDEKGNKFIMGFAGVAKAIQIMHYVMKIPNMENNDGIMSYFVNKFVPSMQSACQDALWLKQANNQSEFSGSLGLIGMQGKLLVISADFTVHIVAEKYFAIGCADDIALGALYATDKLSDPRQRIRIALSAAAKYSSQVRKPFTILST